MRSRRFYLTEEEIIQLLNVDDSDDDERALELDEEDIVFLEEDAATLQPGTEIVIDDILAENEQPSTSAAARERSATLPQVTCEKLPTTEPLTFKWKNAEANYTLPKFTDPDFEYGKVLLPIAAPDSLVARGVPSVYDVFSAVSNLDTMLKLIKRQSEIYAEQKGKVFLISLAELKAFLGIILCMTIHRLPDTRLYWSTLPIYSVPLISNVMCRKRFEEIRSCLHFSNNVEQPSRDNPSYDRAYKIRPIIIHFNKAFANAMCETKCQAIDEHMVKFKGRNIMKQYMKDKPISWGFKMWCRCDSPTGYLHKFDIYTGKKSQKEIGIGESIVLDMAEGLDGMGIELYFDNFFNNPKLLYTLKERDIRACGTLRSNRKQMPKFDGDKEFKRGEFQCMVDNGVAVLKWMENRAVFLGSNFLPPLESVNVKRRQAGSATKIDVKCPVAIQHYNKGMGGVDLMDQKKSYYEHDRKSKTKFYLRLFYDLFDLSVHNAYIVYNKISTSNNDPFSVSALEFRAQLATQLIDSFSSRKRPPPTSVTEGSKRVKLAQVPTLSGHYLCKSETGRKRCIVCSKQGKENRTNSICAICKKPFCFNNERNCSEMYHKK